MTLEEAYEMRRLECLALKRENEKLAVTVEKLRKGAYSDPDRIDHIKQISALSRQLQEKEKTIDRYKKLHEEDQLSFLLIILPSNSPENKR